MSVFIYRAQWHCTRAEEGKFDSLLLKFAAVVGCIPFFFLRFGPLPNVKFSYLPENIQVFGKTSHFGIKSIFFSNS